VLRIGRNSASGLLALICLAARSTRSTGKQISQASGNSEGFLSDTAAQQIAEADRLPRRVPCILALVSCLLVKYTCRQSRPARCRSGLSVAPCLRRHLARHVGGLARPLGGASGLAMFEHSAFIVLDVPPPVAHTIQAWRDRFDPVVATFPVEITVIGSSGIGTIANDQDQASVFATLERLAKKLVPFKTAFTSIARFPNTNIFYGVPAHPEHFALIQNTIVGSGIKFNESPYPYTPHCTIRSISPMAEGDEQALLSLEPPRQEFLLEVLAVYELADDLKCTLLHRTQLSGGR